jgi:hypothetical protein
MGEAFDTQAQFFRSFGLLSVIRMKLNVSEVQAGIFSCLTEELVIKRDFLTVISLYYAKTQLV